jgi:hypothetical protein
VSEFGKAWEEQLEAASSVHRLEGALVFWRRVAPALAGQGMGAVAVTVPAKEKDTEKDKGKDKDNGVQGGLTGGVLGVPSQGTGPGPAGTMTAPSCLQA